MNSVRALGIALGALSACTAAPHEPVADAAANWLTYGRTNSEQRFSPLTQINEQSVGCQRCHGVDAASGGSVPDLRYAQDSTHAEFEAIVRGGARRLYGMPSFDQDLTAEQVRQVHTYVLDRTRAAASH